MRKLHLSIAAAVDLENILQYTLDNWGVIQFEKYLDNVRQVFKTIKIDPSWPLITKRDELIVGCHSVHSGHHVIFFRMTKHNIEIIRTFHEKMDFSNHLVPEE